MESFSAISNTEKAPGSEMLPALFWYLKVCRAVFVAIPPKVCYPIFMEKFDENYEGGQADGKICKSR